MYKLVVSSFDNTLINSEEAISTSTMIKLDNIRNNGYLFGISTNRSYKDVLDYNRDFPFIDYIISYNGAYVYDVNKKKVLFKKSLLVSNMRQIYNKFKDYKLLFYSEEDVYNNFNNKKIYKIKILCNKDELDDISNELDKLNLDIIYYKNCDYNNYSIEIFHNSVNKLIGIEKICGKKILLNEVLYIGYDITDVDVFKNVGFSSIVSNGDLKLKKYVDDVTFSNDEKGVEKILDKML